MTYRLFLRLMALCALVAAVLIQPVPAIAQSAETLQRIRSAVEGFSGGRLKVDEVRRTPLSGIFEVRIQNELLYVDERGQYLFYSGDLIDMKSQRNLTRERVEELLTIDFRELPLDLAVTQKIGAGRRVLAVFEDPNCGYCKKLRADLLRLDDVTLYTFPMAFLAPDSESKAARALCAPDPVRAWNELMLNNRVPANDGRCATSIAKVAELARRLGITGTPVVFFANGRRLQGYAPPDSFDRMLAEASRR
ncbi:MAG: DsbC family protein [Betaproteobacteria bacterium]|nr:DsbC family protein [Betaproteobacteria bacterium]